MPARPPQVPPPDAAAPPLTWVERLAAIDGVDAALGLRNLGGNAAALARTVRRFIGMYGAGVDIAAPWDTPRDRARVGSAAHSLRGACATLGMVRMADALAAFEAALAVPQDRAGLQASSDHVARELRDLTAALRRALDGEAVE
jgi:HPt (histidine-containing phosphotransfer) domain-containing protein